jgi:hypothetical protein
MRKHALALAILFVFGAALTAYLGWAFYLGSRTGDGWASLRTAWPYLLAGVLTVAAVIALFVRLAFYSDTHGYDQRAGHDGPAAARTQRRAGR